MNINRKKFIEEFIYIKTKESTLIKLKFNQAQQKIYEIIKSESLKNKPIRLIILKSRQLGISTEIEALNYVNTTTKKNINTGIITHDREATRNLYNMTKLMYDMMPDKLKPSTEYNSRNELVFDNDNKTGLKSSIKCMTAGTESVGRSSTFHNLHISEYAFWPNDKKTILNGLLQTVPNIPGTMVVIESTPNGFEHFQELWTQAVNGENDFIPVFLGWNEISNYQMPYDGFELTEEEQILKENYNLSNEQIAWRRYTIKNNCGNDIDQFHQEYPICPEEAFLSTGSCIFPKQKILNVLPRVKDSKKVGYFEYEYLDEQIKNFKWVDDEKGCIKIFEDVKVGYPYVLGGDTAGIGSDSYCGDVIDNTNANQVATLEILRDEIEYTYQMYCLGMYYNQALIGIEANYSTYPVKELYRLKYPKQYIREIDEGIVVKTQDKLGWWTSTSTRPVLLGYLVKFVDEEIHKINDINTLKQMLTFVKKPNGKKEAENGYHDDRVMSLGIAHQCRDQQSYVVEKINQENTIDWPDELKTSDDYDNQDINDYLGW